MNSSLSLTPGSEVMSAGKRYIIQSAIGFDAVIAIDVGGTAEVRLAIKDLSVPQSSPHSLPDLASIDSAKWDIANKRRDLILPLVDVHRVPKATMDHVASELGVHRTTVGRWLENFRISGELTSSLLPSRKQNSDTKPRLPQAVEAIVRTTIDTFYLTEAKPSKLDTVREIQKRCRNAQLVSPHANTIYNRIARISPKEKLTKHGFKKIANERYSATPGTYSQAVAPLSVVQMDHALLDIYVVDQATRRAIGRPTITIAIDVFSRCALGFYLSLEKNGGALATGQCIVHAAFPKETWLAERGVEGSWNCWGFPKKLHVDNAKDFRGSMVERACANVNPKIDIDFRPVREPRFGGHIERFIGTLQGVMHKLPGTTFSSPEHRGDYDPVKKAKLSLTELETIIADWIVNIYHTRVHAGIKMPPERLWHHGMFVGDNQRPASGLPNRPTNLEQRRLDFMPHARRSVTHQYGIAWDNVHYYHDVLKPYVSDGRSYIVKRDPRDISAIFFYHEDTKSYSRIPYANISLPQISIWEYREIQKQLEAEGRANVDEAAIFEAYERINRRVEEATKETHKTRRAGERRLAATSAAPAKSKAPEAMNTDSETSDPPETGKRFGHVKPYSVTLL